jgi:LPXTG-motif cell wall-anchored protein
MTRRRHTDLARRRCSATALLGVTALLLVGAGTALAVPGPSGRGSAAVAQYGEPPAAAAPANPPANPPASSGSPPTAATPPAEPPTLSPPADEPGAPKSSEAEDRRNTPGTSNRPPNGPPTREVVQRVEAGQLPLTGMAIVPVLAAGLLLLLAGLLIRRRAQTLA